MKATAPGSNPPEVSPVQISFFELSDAERDARTGDEWILSTIAYLEWRAGCSWRKLHRPEQRWSPVRWACLDAIRLLLFIRYATEADIQAKYQQRPGSAAQALPPKKQPGRHLPTLKQISNLKAAL